MCGIVGAVARDNVVPTLIEGIRRLEYRGYDSSGLAVINGGLHRLVSTARVADLAARASATGIVGARAGSPLLVGIGEHDHFLASDASALAPVTRRVAYLEEGDVADIHLDSYAIYDASEARVTRQVVTVKTADDAVELGPYRHYMQKEIFEQPRAVADTLESVGTIE